MPLAHDPCRAGSSWCSTSSTATCTTPCPRRITGLCSQILESESRVSHQLGFRGEFPCPHRGASRGKAELGLDGVPEGDWLLACFGSPVLSSIGRVQMLGWPLTMSSPFMRLGFCLVATVSCGIRTLCPYCIEVRRSARHRPGACPCACAQMDATPPRVSVGMCSGLFRGMLISLCLACLLADSLQGTARLSLPRAQDGGRRRVARVYS